MARAKVTYLEEIVWDALKNPICPKEHRYRGPGKSLPCRWCRTAQAVMAVLRKMVDENISPFDMLDLFSRDVRTLNETMRGAHGRGG